MPYYNIICSRLVPIAASGSGLDQGCISWWLAAAKRKKKHLHLEKRDAENIETEAQCIASVQQHSIQRTERSSASQRSIAG